MPRSGLRPARLSFVYRMCHFATGSMSGTFVREEWNISLIWVLYLLSSFSSSLNDSDATSDFLYESALLAALWPLHVLMISQQHQPLRKLSLGGKKFCFSLT